MTHLDTSFLVDLLREGPRGGQGAAHAMLDRLPGQELVVSVHVACELFAGAELSADPARERERVTSSTMDMLIGTAALVDDAPLVTRNARDFERLPGLRVVTY